MLNHELLVYGFIHTTKECHLIIPEEIAQVTLSFYLVTDFFEEVGSNIELDKDRTLILKQKGYNMTNEYQQHMVIYVLIHQIE